jgi:hypothetical protein
MENLNNETATPEERAIMISENQIWQLNEYLALNLTKIVTHLKDIPTSKAQEAMYAYGFFIKTVKEIGSGATGETIEERVISDYLESKKKEEDKYWEKEIIETIGRA